MPHSQGLSHEGKRHIRHSLIALPRSTKRLLMLVADLLMLPTCLWGAIALKYDSLTLGFQQSPLLYAGAAATSIVVFMKLGLYRAIMRFIGFRMLAAVFAGAVASGLIVWLSGLSLATLPIGEGIELSSLWLATVISLVVAVAIFRTV